MPGAAEHAALLGHQGKEVAGTNELFGLRGRVDDGPHRPRPLLGADPRATRPVIHRDRERSLVRRRVVVNHRAELEPGRDIGHDGHAQLPPPMCDHELDRLGRDFLRRRDEISLVLPILVVHDDDDPTLLQGLDRFLDLREFFIHDRFLTAWMHRRARHFQPVSRLYPMAPLCTYCTRPVQSGAAPFRLDHRRYEGSRIRLELRGGGRIPSVLTAAVAAKTRRNAAC